MNFDNICYLNHRISRWVWKLDTISRHFNIQWQYSQRCNFVILFGANGLNCSIVYHIYFNLTGGNLIVLGPNAVIAFGQLDPRHARHILIDHVSQTKWNWAFISHFWKSIKMSIVRKTVFLKFGANLIQLLGQFHIYLQEPLRCLIVVHDTCFKMRFNLSDRIHVRSLASLRQIFIYLMFKLF